MAIKKNIGVIDRAIRIIVGILLISSVSLTYADPVTPWTYIGLLGIFPIIAGIIGYCPPYAWLGINTYKK